MRSEILQLFVVTVLGFSIGISAIQPCCCDAPSAFFEETHQEPSQEQRQGSCCDPETDPTEDMTPTCGCVHLTAEARPVAVSNHVPEACDSTLATAALPRSTDLGNERQGAVSATARASPSSKTPIILMKSCLLL